MGSVMKSGPQIGLLFAVALLLVAAGCKPTPNGEPAADPFAASPSEQAPDPLREAHQRGWLWAQRNDAKLLTDCGAVENEDERFGCATFVNNRSD